jgi:hypothetical protein
VKPIGPPVARWADSTVCFAVHARGIFQADASAIHALRQTLTLPTGNPLPPAFLKHSDEQTVVGLAAVFQAIRDCGLAGACFTDWGVLGAARFFGRSALANALQRFALEGAWGVSPHLIPHRSQHSLSGTISQALGIRGPNLGVGGGTTSAAELALMAATTLAEKRLPGLWVVLTGWDPEPFLTTLASANGHRPAIPSICNGVALALTEPAPGWTGITLQLRVAVADEDPTPDVKDADPFSFSLESLLQALAKPQGEKSAWRLGHTAWLELHAPTSVGETCS